MRLMCNDNTKAIPVCADEPSQGKVRIYIDMGFIHTQISCCAGLRADDYHKL